MLIETRRSALLVGAAAFSASLPLAPAAASQTVSAKTKVYEHTHLKAKDGLRTQLGQYIKANWFVLDQVGIERGIFTSYWLLEETGSNPNWDFVMVVGYPQDLGFADPRTAEIFQDIRRAHQDVKISGKGLRDLGDIVGSFRLKVAV